MRELLMMFVIRKAQVSEEDLTPLCGKKIKHHDTSWNVQITRLSESLQTSRFVCPAVKNPDFQFIVIQNTEELKI